MAYADDGSDRSGIVFQLKVKSGCGFGEEINKVRYKIISYVKG